MHASGNGSIRGVLPPPDLMRGNKRLIKFRQSLCARFFFAGVSLAQIQPITSRRLRKVIRETIHFTIHFMVWKGFGRE